MEKDFYAKSLEFYYTTKGLSTFETQALKHPFLEEIPKYLYKYRKSGNEGRADFYVKQRKIYTASLNNLNDIFEGLTPATKDRIKKSSLEELCSYYKDDLISILVKRFPSLDKEQSKALFEMILEEHFNEDAIYERAKGLVNKKEQKELKTIISAFSYLFDSLENDMDQDSDFSKGMQLLMDTNDLVGVFCMSDNYSNENLWALYADEFKGYCIEYDLTEPCKSRGSIRFISNLYPVNYVDKKDDDWFKPLFESTIATVNIDGRANRFDSGLIFQLWMIRTICSKKKNRWSNENEWREIGKANASSKGPLISSVIVGHKISKADFERLASYSVKHGYSIFITDIDYVNQTVIKREITEEDLKLIYSR